MNITELLDILNNVTGDAKGIKADDLLLAIYRRAKEVERKEFWNNFHQILVDLWRNVDDFNNSHAIAAAAAFIARLRSEEMPIDSNFVAGFLLSEGTINPNIERPQAWLGIVSALRILTHLGLGDALFWRKQFKFWLKYGFSSETYNLSLLDGLVQAVRGVVATDGLTDGDFAILFENALKLPDFPALEVYSALVEETIRERNQHDFDPERINNAIMDVFSDINEGCHPQGYSKNMKYLRDVINAWTIDVLNLEQPEETESHDYQHTRPWKLFSLQQNYLAA